MSVTGQDRVLPLRERFLRPVLHTYWRFSRGLTLGVRGVARDAAGRVFLVRHTYTPGWHLPGGGVEAGETCLDALRRELAEEGNIAFDAPPILHGIFFNGTNSRRDHVLVYIVEDARQHAPRGGDMEIAETGFFAPDALPPETTRGTRARLAEILNSAPRAMMW